MKCRVANYINVDMESSHPIALLKTTLAENSCKKKKDKKIK